MNTSNKHGDNSLMDLDFSPETYYNKLTPSTPASGNSLKNRVLGLKSTGARLLNDSLITEGLDCYTSMFNVLKTMSISDGAEFNEVFIDSIEELNKIAMKFVQHNDNETGHIILSFCDENTQPGKHGQFPLQRTRTMNNIGCLYRRVGKPKAALNYLRTALMILSKNNLMEHAAVTYLNLSAVQSQLGDHQQAYQSATSALIYAQKEMVLYQDTYHEDVEKYKEKVMTLAIVYHNMASEEEHLQNLKSALDCYEKAYLVMDEYGVVDEKLYQKFRNAHLLAQEKYGTIDMHNTRRIVSPMSTAASFTSLKTPPKFFESLSAAGSPRDASGRMKLGVVDVHHRGAPKNEPLKTFVMKDKRIVSQPRLAKSPLTANATPSHTPTGGQMARTWGSKSTSRVNPRPLNTLTLSIHNRNEGVKPNWFGSRSVSEKEQLPQGDSGISRTNSIAENCDGNVNDEDCESYYKVNVYKVRKVKPIETSSVVKVPEIKTEEEIKALEDMGILDWSDTNIDASTEKKNKKEAIKKNQKKFITTLKEASATNITGKFKLMDSSESSCSEPSTPKKKPKKNKKKKKNKRKETSPDSSSPRSKKELEQSKKSARKEEQAPQEVVSALEKKNSKGSKHEVEEKIEQENEVMEEIIGEEAVPVKTVSKLNQSQNMSRLPEEEKSILQQSEHKFFKESKTIITPTNKQRVQQGGSMKFGALTREKSNNEAQTLSMQWNEITSGGDKAEEVEEPVTPRVVLTKAQLMELGLKRMKAAVMIQRAYKRKLRRDRIKLLRKAYKKRSTKFILLKKWIILKANKTVKKEVVEQEAHDYCLNIFVVPDNKVLLFILNDGSTKLRYETEVSYEDVELIKDQPASSSYNMHILVDYCEKLLPRMYIMDHLLLFREEEKKPEENKDNKDKEDTLSVSVISEPEPTRALAPIDYKAHEDKILKIQARFRGNKIRQEVAGMKARNFSFLHREVIKVDGQLIRFRILQYHTNKKILATGMHLTSKKKFKNLELPPQFMEGLGRRPEDVVNRLDFDLDRWEISLLPATEAWLFPEKRVKGRKYKLKYIVMIQMFFRRMLVKHKFELQIKKMKENSKAKLIKKYILRSSGVLFMVRILFNSGISTFTITAKSSEYHADIEPLVIPVDGVDRHDFVDSLCNVKRLVDIMVPYVQMRFTEKETFEIDFDRREYDKNARRFESRLLNFEMVPAMTEAKEQVQETDEVRGKIWAFLQDKSFVETNKHILKNIFGLQTVTDTFKILEDLNPGISDLGRTEDKAATKIQAHYRMVVLKRYFKVALAESKLPSNRQSSSQILCRSVQGKSYSLFCKAYQRMTVSEDELRRQNTNDFYFVKTVSGIQFSNTKLEAKAHVFYNKSNPKEKTVEVEIIIPPIGLHDYLVIPEGDISEHGIRSSSFLKKIDELLISKLEYNEIKKKVIFNKDGVRPSEQDMVERTKPKLNAFIQSKLIRLKFLRRKLLTKGMWPVKVQTTEIDKLFIHMSLYWHVSLKQLRILVEQINDLTHHKDIIVKFNTLESSKELKKLVQSEDIKQSEFTERVRPYVDYIARHIILQHEAKSSGGSSKDFKVMMDGTVFKVEFVNSRFIVVSLKDMNEEVLKEIMSKSCQADSKYVMRGSKLLDVQQFENLFPKKVDLKDILDGDNKDKEGRTSDALDFMKQSGTLGVSRVKNDGLKKRKSGRAEKLKAALMIQKVFRGITGRKLSAVTAERRSKEFQKNKSFGKLVRKTAKKIEEDYWTINVYKRPLPEENASMYYFFALHVSAPDRPAKTQAKGVFRADHMLFVNSDGKDLADTLIERMQINGQTIEFDMEKSNFIKMEDETPKPVIRYTESIKFAREVELPTESVQEHQREMRTEEEEKKSSAAPGEVQHATRLLTVENDRPDEETPFASARSQYKQATEIMIMDRDLKQKQKKKLELLRKETTKEVVPDNLLNQKTEAHSNNLLLYDVYYNNQDSALRPAVNPLLLDQHNVQGPLARKSSITVSTDNVVKISVDMKELRKYNPTLDPKSSVEIKQIAAELTSSIQINKRGELLVDSSKLNPNALNIIEKKVSVVEHSARDLDKDSRNNRKKKVLCKVTKVYGDKKYLLLVNYIERPSNLNNVLSIVRKEDDQVYEEFELFLEVNVVCLSNNAIKPLTWELTLQEGQQLSGLTLASEVAKFFAGNIHLFGDQILLSTPFQPNDNHKNVMIMNENAIKMIQNKFRSRKFTKNFMKFRANLLLSKTRIITRAVIAINNVSYQALGYEHGENSLDIEVWSLTNYEKSKVTVSKKFVEKLYAKDKKQALSSIFKFLKFELNKKKEHVLILKEQSMFDYLRKRGEL